MKHVAKKVIHANPVTTFKPIIADLTFDAVM
jgi:hypothetical protein